MAKHTAKAIADDCKRIENILNEREQALKLAIYEGKGVHEATVAFDNSVAAFSGLGFIIQHYAGAFHVSRND